MAAEYNATVSSRVEVAPGLVIMRVVPDKLPFEFKAGQYVVLGLKASAPRIDEAEGEDTPDMTPGGAPEMGTVEGTPESLAAVEAQAASIATAVADPNRMIRRAYSIASESRTDEFVEFYLTVVMSGELTPRLFNLKLRDRLYIGPKAVGVFARQGPGQEHPHDRDRHRSRAVHVDASQRAGLQRIPAIRGRPRRPLLVGPRLSDRAERPRPPLPELPLHAGHHQAG